MVTRPARHHQAERHPRTSQIAARFCKITLVILIINNLTFIAIISNEDVITIIILI